jgi:hypothetical protein
LRRSLGRSNDRAFVDLILFAMRKVQQRHLDVPIHDVLVTSALEKLRTQISDSHHIRLLDSLRVGDVESLTSILAAEVFMATEDEIRRVADVFTYRTTALDIGKHQTKHGLLDVASPGVDKLKAGDAYFLEGALLHKYVPSPGTVSVVIRKGRIAHGYYAGRRFEGLDLENEESDAHHRYEEDGSVIDADAVRQTAKAVLALLEN